MKEEQIAEAEEVVKIVDAVRIPVVLFACLYQTWRFNLLLGISVINIYNLFVRV